MRSTQAVHPRRLLDKARIELTRNADALALIPEDAPPTGEVATDEQCVPAYSAAMLLAQREALLSAMPVLIARAFTTAQCRPCRLYGVRCAHPGCGEEIGMGEEFLRLSTPGYASMRLHIPCAEMLTDMTRAQLVDRGGVL